MIFVLFTYGGWNEAAYLSAEVRDKRRTIARALMVSIGVVTAIYLIMNIALIKGLGLTAAAESDAVAADLMRRMFGESGARFISLLIVIAAASTMNGVVITGARTNYALGRDFVLFSFMGRWREKGSTPVNALLLQGAIALALVAVGALSHNGFVMMVEYTAPVFWLFFFLTGVSLMALRRSEPGTERPFRVPLYPAIPLLFCAFCLYMLHASLAYTGVGAVIGVVVLLAGAPLLWVKKRRFNNKPTNGNQP
jgi:amino acid transporter